MKKINFLALLLFVGYASFAQITQTSYRGAFAPAPTTPWTQGWTDFDPQNTVHPSPNVNVSGAITTNTTWTTGNTYLLQGLVYVKNNATLTIQPGVKILGDNTGAALIVTKGAKLNAIGTANAPIVFTSDKAPGSRNKGDWGGVILLGKGSFNINGGVNYIEGIAQSSDTQYGGGASPDDNDNSGTLKYVRIEFGGYVYAPNSEINGLTMGAVGRGTTIDYVQVSHVNDDAFEWFGGSVNCKHLVSFRNLDDDFDADNGYNGNVQFGLAIRDPQVADAPAVSTSEGFEVDNNPTGSSVSPYTSPIFSNMTLIGPSYRVTLPNGGTLASGYKRALRLRRNNKIKIYNSIFMDFQEGLHIDGSTTETNALNNELKYQNNILAGIVTTSKVLQVSSPGTITVGNNPSFNMQSWYDSNGNSTLSNNSGLLTTPYNASDATVYTGLDYRPATESPALTGASFADSSIAAVSDPIPTTTMKSTSCGITLAALNTNVFANANANAQKYKFKVVNGGTIRYYETTNNYFNFTQLSSSKYSTAHQVSVAIMVEGLWSAYSATCTVTTPAAPLTKIRTNECGVTLPQIKYNIYANSVANVEGYKFEIVNGGTTRYYETTSGSRNYFSLTQVPGSLDNMTYTVRVATKTNGSWNAYGDACTVSTPVPVLKLKNSSCGISISSLYSNIYTDLATNIQGYKFEIVNGGTTRYHETTLNYFKLSDVAGTLYNTAYTIRVSVKANDTYYAYGAACTVTTLGVPNTKLKTTSCGATLAAINNTIYANAVPFVEGYKFEVTNGGTTRYYEHPTKNYFNLIQLAGGAAYNTTYTIRVATKYNSVYGSYGASCTVTTPASAPKGAFDEEVVETSVKAYPNPFENTYKVDFSSPSKDNVTINVYDLSGRLVEVVNGSVEEVNSKDFGSHYVPGVYIVTIQQADFTSTVKVIKN